MTYERMTHKKRAIGAWAECGAELSYVTAFPNWDGVTCKKCLKRRATVHKRTKDLAKFACGVDVRTVAIELHSSRSSYRGVTCEECLKGKDRVAQASHT